MSVQQFGKNTFETFVIDDLFADRIQEWKDFVMNANIKNRTFTYSDFKNGKVIMPEVSQVMWDKIKKVLPDIYIDDQGLAWRFEGVTKYVMYALLEPGQSFPIHTDTGAEYSADGKQSKFTVLIYLNDNFQGGATQFYDKNFTRTFEVTPKTGRTLVFDIELFHAGSPIEQGQKLWIGTELVCSPDTTKFP